MTIDNLMYDVWCRMSDGWALLTEHGRDGLFVIVRFVRIVVVYFEHESLKLHECQKYRERKRERSGNLFYPCVSVRSVFDYYIEHGWLGWDGLFVFVRFVRFVVVYFEHGWLGWDGLFWICIKEKKRQKKESLAVTLMGESVETLEGDSVGTRTQGLLLRRQLLYPAELRNRPFWSFAGAKVDIFSQSYKF